MPAHCLAAKEAREATTDKHPNLVQACIFGSKAAQLQYCLSKALQYGWLSLGQTAWNIEIHGAGSAKACFVAALADIMHLTSSLCSLYKLEGAPSHVYVRTDTEERWMIDPQDGNFEKLEPFEDADFIAADVSISIDDRGSPYASLDPESHDVGFVIRPVFLPVLLSAEHVISLDRISLTKTALDDAKAPLTTFLQHIFRKREFWNLQAEAILNVIRGKDSIALLPTGAGKSIIYQLSGLILPGITLVIDPIISLIEDQIEGLMLYGIDRAIGISGAIGSGDERRKLLLKVERGEFLFILVSPERLQSPEFRQTLRALSEASLVNIAVIDEAHCVSEWGHDFRPAYLNLGRNLRRFCRARDDSPPPLLALTGTASRAVLRDVLTELEIDRGDSEAVIRPQSFDRPELNYDIARLDAGGDEHSILRGIVNSLPKKFGVPQNDFFTPAARNTFSGIVFTPFVNGRTHGVLAVRDIVRSAARTGVTIYSGKEPRGVATSSWEREKRQNATDFKQNRAPVLVATKAFGMGIDKPNIRYTIHLGMPGSLEGFYQETGRAGRNRLPALCTVIFSEFDSALSDAVLDPNNTLEELKGHYNRLRKERGSDDDIRRALWFHMNAFSGIEQDIECVSKVLESAGDLTERRWIELPFWAEDDEKSQERAIYRLVKIGVFDDYEVHYGSKIFAVLIRQFDLQFCKSQLLDYVQASQPAKIRAFRARIDELTDGSSSELAIELARMLVEFTYDVIERSRRRMIQEAVLLARTCRTDKEVRRQLLDYLQEGFGAEQIEQLIDEPDIDFSEWLSLLENVSTPIDAGELRGICIRALESYPDHPGLLLVRGLTECMASEPEESVISSSLNASFEKALTNYRCPFDDIERCFDEVLELAEARIPTAQAPLIYSVATLTADSPEQWHPLMEKAKTRVQRWNPVARMVLLTFETETLTRRVTALGDELHSKYERLDASQF